MIMFKRNYYLVMDIVMTLSITAIFRGRVSYLHYVLLEAMIEMQNADESTSSCQLRSCKIDLLTGKSSFNI